MIKTVDSHLHLKGKRFLAKEGLVLLCIAITTVFFIFIAPHLVPPIYETYHMPDGTAFQSYIDSSPLVKTGVENTGFYFLIWAYPAYLAFRFILWAVKTLQQK